MHVTHRMHSSKTLIDEMEMVPAHLLATAGKRDMLDSVSV